MLLSSKICYRIRKDILHLVPLYVLVQVAALAFAVSHLAENQAVIGDDALNSVERAVGVVGGVHAHVAVFITVLERDLSVLEKLFRQLPRHYKLALAVADRNLVDITLTERSEPWGVGTTHTGSHDAGDVAIDVVSVERRGFGRDFP